MDSSPRSGLVEFYRSVRQRTLRLIETLSAEDMLVQSMPDASPTKWHLAHTTWFFEEFVLCGHGDGYRRFDGRYRYLFNSYYDAVGDRHPRHERGLLTHPRLDEILRYRAYVDSRLEQLIGRERQLKQPLHDIIVTGLHHEMQHQELLLTDILHALSFNPLSPAVFTANADEAITSTQRRQAQSGQTQFDQAQFDQAQSDQARSDEAAPTSPTAMHTFEGGLVAVGASGEGFSYDCERPRHTVFLQPYRLANRPVTNGEWLAFMADGGYRNSRLWLADGWDTCQRQRWQAPLYWRRVEEQWLQFGLDGLQALDTAAPVCHISYYEADAYARWAGKRLPSEQEWEHSVGDRPVAGNVLESARWRPQASAAGPVAVSLAAAHSVAAHSVAAHSVAKETDMEQMYGDVWEWTHSPYMAYPGFSPEHGLLQEYNGKFMANQFVLKGGSCVTPKRQLRASYRNFFYPHQRWQFTGLRLAEDD